MVNGNDVSFLVGMSHLSLKVATVDVPRGCLFYATLENSETAFTQKGANGYLLIDVANNLACGSFVDSSFHVQLDVNIYRHSCCKQTASGQTTS